MRFNPRAREGRDTASNFEPQFLGVSIRAPVRGATMISVRSSHLKSFNPRAREGRDPMIHSMGRGTACFNPRAREGRDR